MKRRAEFTTFKISSRALLFRSSNAVVASTVASVASEPSRRDQGPSGDLQALIETHKKTYAVPASGRDYDRASRAEEEALLAICAHPAVRKGDRFAKARYPLEIEARGELDLPEHMQALLRSAMWKEGTDR
ncbi:hypothetical protein [Mesorhizobium sp.]|uniref:hypothetical protein n=1 Tax=Mesorhizobium sp. TaxID=1871066 RepID=UPI000FE661FF|nr:hypothetical protein [Mesorhizobium sp.]RWB69752.1 MAG: hypothetical protein EOQ49_19375 [Mesorhizobium sp.]